MFLAGALTYIAGLIYSENFTKAETLAWVVPNILIYVLFSVLVLMLLPFELMVGCCIGYNPKSTASDYVQRRRRFRGQWRKKHQEPIVVHHPIIKHVHTEHVEVRATHPPKMTGIYKEMAKTDTLTEKTLRQTFLGIVNSKDNFHTPKGSHEESKFFEGESAMKSDFTPENWKMNQDLGRARDSHGQYKGRVDPAKSKNRDLSKTHFRLAEEDVMMRNKAIPHTRQSPSKSYVSNTQLAKGHNAFKFNDPGFKGEMVKSRIGEELGYSSMPQVKSSMNPQGAQNYRSEMQWPQGGGVRETEGANAKPIGNHRQGPMPN
jgi:hypothetical protein